MRAPIEDESWKQLEQLFHEAVALRPDSRSEFLENACPDERLRAELRSLLTVAISADSFLEDPLIRTLHVPALAAGARIAGFEVVELVGWGGMGEVYRARDLRLDREVAVKVLPKALASDHAGIARLRQEARVLAALNHPNIASIYEFVEDSGRFAVVLEFVEGETLAERLPLGAPSPEAAWVILRQIAHALEAAHSKGIIHRDLKPSNVRITAEGQVKLLDFGLAKIQQQISEPTSGADPKTESQLTKAGAILGTPAYMSPEQARGQAVDQRTDIWSFACLVYEALAGHPVFSGSNSLDIIAAVLRDKPVLTLPDGVPIGLGVVLENCLQRDVNERPQCIYEVRTRIEACFANPEAVVLQVAPVAQRWLDRKIALFACVAVIVILAAAYGFSRWKASRQNSQGTPAFQHARMIRVTTSGQASDAAISRDGKYVAYVEHGALRIREMNSERDVEIAASANEGRANLTFSPDGTQIYYTQADGDLYATPTLGGMAKKIHSDVGAISFSPGGDQFVFSRFDEPTGVSGIFLAHANGPREWRIAIAKFPRWVGFPAWSLRGDIIAYAAAPKGFFRYDVVTQAPKLGAPARVLTPYPWSGDLYSAWTDNGSALVLSAEDRGKGLQQIWTLTYPDGRIRKVTNDLDEYSGVSATADSRALVSTRIEEKVSLWVQPPSAGLDSARAITSPTSLDSNDALTWTPDNRIIFSSMASGSNELWIMNEDGRSKRRLTYTGARNIRPHVSHDGKFVLFGSNRTGGTNLWRMALDGTDLRQVTFGDSDLFGDLSPDNSFIVFASLKSGQRLLHKISIADGLDTILSDFPVPVAWYGPSFSPDGKLIAFLFFDTARKGNRYGVIPASGGPLIASFDADGKDGLEWTRDSHGLTYISKRDGVDNLWVQPLAGGPPHQITHLKEGQIWAFAWRWDGKVLVVARGELTTDVVALQRTD